MTARATGRHRAETTVSTPLTTMTAAIATKVPSASAARSGFVIAVSSGLVAGVGLPAQAAGTTSDGATTASLKLPALAPAAEQVAVDEAVSAPATAKLRFDRSTMRVSLRKGTPTADSSKAAENLVRVSRSLARAAFAQQLAAQRRVQQQQAQRTTTHHTSTSSSSTSTHHSSPAPVSTPHNSSRGAAVVATAMRYLGVPYVYGGMSPRGFDCSGLVGYVYAKFGFHLARSAQGLYDTTRHISSSEAGAGDLVFFHTGGGVTHVGIVIKHGVMIAAPHTGDVVKVQSIYSANVSYGRVG